MKIFDVHMRLNPNYRQRIKQLRCRKRNRMTNHQTGEVRSHPVHFKTPDTYKSRTVQKNGLISWFIKVLLSVLFFLFAIIIFIAILRSWNQLWIGGFQNFFVIVVLLYGLIFVALGIEVLREDDRNFLVSFFSSLVSFVALVITMLK